MSDIPILHKVDEPEETNTEEVSKALSEVSQQIGFLSGTIKDAKDVTSQATQLVTDTLLGDVSFITKPVEELSSIGKKMGGFFTFKKRIPPKRSAMLKTNPEVVYTVDSLTKTLEEDDNVLDKFKGILPYLMGAGGLTALAKTFGPAIMKAGAIGLLAGGLLWMAIDGIKGYFKAEEWGTSKLAAVIGGALGGTGDGGWKSAFKGMGKGAMVGAGAGFLIGGPVGALIGGLIGAATGGILGYLGGQKIAKFADKVGDDFKKSAKSWSEGWSVMGENMKNSWTSFKTAWGDGKEKFAEWGELMKESIGKFFTFVKDGFNSFIETSLDIATLVGGWINDKIISPVSAFFSNIYDNINLATDGALDKIDMWIEDFLIAPIKDFFSMIGGAIGDFFVNLFGDKRTEEEIAFDKAKSDKLRAEALERDRSGRYTGVPTETTSTIPNYRTVQDAIIKPDGSIIHTDIDDTLIATKNPVAFADKELESNMSAINTPIINDINKLVELVKQSLLKSSENNQNNILTNNYTSRYNPLSIMNNLTAEVF